MLWLKQSTAIDIGLGPFLDDTDGKTAETALTITQPDIRLKKNGGAWAQKNAAQTLTHEEAGWYEVALDTTDTNTLGCLLVAIHEAGALPVWREFMIVPANIYDSLVGGSDALDVSVIQWLGTASATPATAGIPKVAIEAAGDFAQGAADKAWSTGTRVLTAGTNIALAKGTGVTGFNDITAAAASTATWEELTATARTAGTYGQLVKDDINATIASRSTYAGGAVASVTGAVGSIAAGGIVAASFGASAIDAAALATDAGQEIADRLIARNIGGGSDAGRTVKELFAAGRNKWTISAGTLTVYDTDDTTVLFTAVVSTTAGNPISAIDP